MALLVGGTGMYVDAARADSGGSLEEGIDVNVLGLELKLSSSGGVESVDKGGEGTGSRVVVTGVELGSPLEL